MEEEEEEAFEREYGVPVHSAGSITIARWGMGLAVLFLSIAFAALLISYFYLRVDNDGWPPAGIEAPPLLAGALATGLVVASAAAFAVALRRVRTGDAVGYASAVVTALMLATAGGVVQVRELAGFDVRWTEHAYASIVFTLAGFCMLVLLGGAVMALLSLYWASRGYYTARRHTVPVNIGFFWISMVVIWVVGYGVIYLAPRVT